ncbi:hypothetical protein [Acinetobacter baumannii]|uniref:hypothetical protein n=1 Tax=Acinetobacter baumannii TaxID=470 RepID=UPI0021C1EF52|nr:hypothetical protein [Acinetobacter baumannii]MDO7484292.1 hypothetical protein [Acinetobacter baumannii]
MFTPNQFCFVRARNGYDHFGLAKFGLRRKERCAIVKMIQQCNKTSVRADSSASRGNAREVVADLVILLEPKTTATIDSIIEFSGDMYVVKSVHKRFDIRGKHDHTEAACTYWSDNE